MESIDSLIRRAVELKRAEYALRGEVVTIGRCLKQATVQFYPPKSV